MTTLHNDPFNTTQVRKEADDDRLAAEKRLEAQEEMRKRSTRQHLEDEKRRLVRERDEKKRKIEELRKEVEAKEQEEKTLETSVRTEHAAEVTDDRKAPDPRQRHLLEARLSRVRASFASLSAPSHQKTEAPEPGKVENLSRNLTTAHAALEKAQLEHTHVTEEIRQLCRMLEQKELQERHLKKEHEEAAANVIRLEKEKETAELDQQMKRRAHRIGHDAELKTEHERQALEKEQEELQRELTALDTKEKEIASEKQMHAEGARKAEAEKRRAATTAHDLAHLVDQLLRELALIEGNLRDVENKLSRL